VIRAVFDTNTLASVAVARSGAMATLLDAWRTRRVEVVTSQHILDELERTLQKPYFTEHLDEAARERFRFLTRAATTIAITTPVPTIASTLDDNLVLATAESAGVSFLVTGDAELLRLRHYKTTFIVTAREFVVVLETEDSQQ